MKIGVLPADCVKTGALPADCVKIGVLPADCVKTGVLPADCVNKESTRVSSAAVSIGVCYTSCTTWSA